jgi:hypothetical protein
MLEFYLSGRGTEDIIEAVANNEIDYTIANKDLALLNKSYFENLILQLQSVAREFTFGSSK